jgi:multicomponent Na+:H+ antiporter subunit G
VSLDTAVTVLGELLVLLGLVVTTLGVYGMYRMPDVFGQVHAASKAVVFGVIALLAATLTLGDAAIAARAVLIAGFLLVTMPVASHVIVLAADRRGERMRGPNTLDERDPPPGGRDDGDGDGAR